ncbi:unnamed protein product [Meganyctiphanes norvegica]|uniref:Taperin n=1 Tax=Meganyctiphanes norvegica TaxID=48144 RepID=A0AAV2QV84_MEGNR
MAALQGYLSGQEATLEDLPPWKRELILRKRASARIHGGMGMPQPQTLMAARPGRSSMSGRPALSSPPGPSAGTLSSPPGPAAVAGSSMSGPGLRSLSGPAPSGPPLPPPPPPPGVGNNWAVSSRLVGAGASSRDGSEGRGYDASLPVTSDYQTSSNMHHKGLCDEGSRVTSPTSSTFSDSYNNCTEEQDPDEELSYGPGIVSKLKNRYMSLAMREQRGRPVLRRFSSLEDLLDDPPVETGGHKGRAAAPTSAAQYRLDRMKRARSVDSLSSRHQQEDGPFRGAGRRPMPKSRSATSNLQSSLMALGKDDVIIIETSQGVPAASVAGQQHQQQQQQQQGQKPFKDTRASVNGGSPRHTDDVPPPLQRKLSSSSLAEEEELPPPDTVRQVRQVFEGGSHVSNKPLRGIAARVAQHKTAKTNGIQSMGAKPALAVKPAVVPSHRKATPPLTPVSPPITSNMPFSIEDAKKRLKHVATVTRPSPRSTMGVKPTPDLNGEVKTQDSEVLRPRPGLTPIIKAHTAPNTGAAITNGSSGSSPPIRHTHPAHDTDSEDDDEDDEGFKKISNAAISNIRKESGLSQEFNFANKTSSSPVVGKSKPSSPTPATLPSSPVASHKVTSTPAKLSENQRVEQENRKNVEKSRSKVEPVKVNLNKVESGVLGGSKVNSSGSGSPNVVLGSSSPVSGSRSPEVEELVEAVNKKPLKASPPKPWHQQQSNTQTFNFTTKKAPVPEHLENDGLDMSVRRPKISADSGYVIMPGFYEGRQDSSTDGDDPDDPGIDYLDSRPGVPPAPCGISFNGEGVIINGRSNLQRQPRNKRLNISFDDSLTRTFEYPSENSLLEDSSEGHGGPVSPDTSDAPGTGGLASYTPSKIQMDSEFKLGVSRTTPINPPASTPGPPAVTERPEEEEYLRPADESETVMWSSGSTSDMLF